MVDVDKAKSLRNRYNTDWWSVYLIFLVSEYLSFERVAIYKIIDLDRVIYIEHIAKDTGSK